MSSVCESGSAWPWRANTSMHIKTCFLKNFHMSSPVSTIGCMNCTTLWSSFPSHQPSQIAFFKTLRTTEQIQIMAYNVICTLQISNPSMPLSGNQTRSKLGNPNKILQQLQPEIRLLSWGWQTFYSSTTYPLASNIISLEHVWRDCDSIFGSYQVFHCTLGTQKAATLILVQVIVWQICLILLAKGPQNDLLSGIQNSCWSIYCRNIW